MSKCIFHPKILSSQILSSTEAVSERLRPSKCEFAPSSQLLRNKSNKQAAERELQISPSFAGFGTASRREAMRRVSVQRFARLSALYTQASAPLSSAAQVAADKVIHLAF
jgi:hypothetical protein